MNRRELLQSGAAGLAAALVPRGVMAQAGYPDRPIRLIVPRPAGGVVDVIAREWAGKVTKPLGAVYIENMGGGGGVIGAAAAARAPADGYTLLFGTNSELVISPLLGQAQYDPVASFEPIAILCNSPAVDRCPSERSRVQSRRARRLYEAEQGPHELRLRRRRYDFESRRRAVQTAGRCA